MPPSGHTHKMRAIAWPTPNHDMPPRVLFGCVTGVCAKTEAIDPKKTRKKPAVLTQTEYEGLLAGKYWSEIDHEGNPWA